MHAIGLLHGIRETFRDSRRAVAAAVALALLALPTLVAADRLDAATGESREVGSATQPGNTRKSVLVLSGANYGAPVSDAITAGATAMLKAQGISGADIYV